MWGLGVLAYGIAVFQRASLGVAGPLAQQRFGATAAALSLFIVLQLSVYAALQVPVGVLVDRLGSRRLIAMGAAIMGLGQIVLAESHSVGLAVVSYKLLLAPVWVTGYRHDGRDYRLLVNGQTGTVAGEGPRGFFGRLRAWIGDDEGGH